ncbi:UNVERIFIED_CONTAM: protein rough sheath 2 [Sesamum radiatum]|uniref:Protein rough sheath 2 n=1 Tax=Sesamum radiatum TaxID=300843 RepID=A0AAW2V433_SESRA
MKERQRWQPEEDALLRAYVKQYPNGTSSPNAWANPSTGIPNRVLSDGKTTSSLGSRGVADSRRAKSRDFAPGKYGNKWKKIAAEVPGRTAKRLGKWWEVFKEKQLKQLQKSQKNHLDYGSPPGVSAVASGGSPVKAAQGKYDHILETFAEKYVQPKLFPFQSATTNMIMPAANLSRPEPPPVLSLGSITEPVNSACTPGAPLPPWMNMNMNTTPTTTSSLTSSSSTPSPSVSLTLSPSEPAVLDPTTQRSQESRPGSSRCNRWPPASAL